jgi:anti-sigma B factor antagonist
MNFALTTDLLDSNVAVLALSGEVDLYTAPELKNELVRVIDAGALGVVVDLEQTTFIDSTTLGVLISGVKRLGPIDGTVEIVVTDHNIRKIFEITGLDRVFALHDSREEALEALGVQPAA